MRSTMNRNFAILKAKKDIMATEAEKSGQQIASAMSREVRIRA